jgi:3',5'-cyclic AMP phosphodiesterase CpdA
VAPTGRPSADALRHGDATTCICVLLLSDRPKLTSEDAARHLRYVPWTNRGKRQLPGVPGSSGFAPADLTVIPDAKPRRLTIPARKDGFGEHIRFGVNASGQHGVTACLANKVRDFYRDVGLAYLYEVRVSEAATARLTDKQYHLFWNNAQPSDTAPSDEMRLLMDGFVGRERPELRTLPEQMRKFLLDGYAFEYGSLNPPYNALRTTAPVRAEVLHPVFVQRHLGTGLRIAHVTDTHISVREDVYEHNLRAAKLRKQIGANEGDWNNFNRSFMDVYGRAKSDADIVLLTGDLIDYGRGHYGRGRPASLGDDNAYFRDRNWWLFYFQLAAGKRYGVPVYTILGNHDWRLNPYPPFAPGANNPNEMLNDHLRLTPDKRKAILQAAHGPGHNKKLSYKKVVEDLVSAVKTGGRAAIDLLKNKGVDVPGFPTETNIESVAWYLLTINPFFDYVFTLPGKQSVLMLDWAQREAVVFRQARNGEKVGLDTGTPRPRNSLTPLQHQLTFEFLSGPSRAKIIGVHAPVVGPHGNWYDHDLVRSRKIYSGEATGPRDGHPLFAIVPSTARDTPHGMVADRGALGNEKEREWLVRTIANEKYHVRLVFSGHIHRNGLYVVYQSPSPIDIVNPTDPSRRRRVDPTRALLVGILQAPTGRAAPPQFVNAQRNKGGPLYITTTSAGPRGTFEKRPLNSVEEKARGTTTDPGYARVELGHDGTIRALKFFGGEAPSDKVPTAPAKAAEMAFAGL